MTKEHSIPSAYEQIRLRIAEACARVGRDPQFVELLAVTKTRPLPMLEELYRAGSRSFGENRVQDLASRVEALPSDIAWHFIGHLQTNKAKYLPGKIHVVHSVDRPDVAKALQKAYDKHPDLAPLGIYLQFNISGEEQKHGAGPDAAEALLRACLEMPRLRVRGLMCMAPYGEEAELSRPVFRQLRLLREELQQRSGVALPGLSMGMTGDFEVAIEEGATIVRVGTALFEQD